MLINSSRSILTDLCRREYIKALWVASSNFPSMKKKKSIWIALFTDPFQASVPTEAFRSFTNHEIQPYVAPKAKRSRLGRYSDFVNRYIGLDGSDDDGADGSSNVERFNFTKQSFKLRRDNDVVDDEGDDW